MVDHLLGHATIDAYVFTGDEAGFVGAEEEYHVGYVRGMPHTPCGMLLGIGAFVEGSCGVDPTG